MLSPDTRPFRALCAAVLLTIVASRQGMLSAESDSPPDSPVPAANAGVLLQRIETAHPEDIGRDQGGSFAFVRLRQGCANDRNLTLVSAVSSLSSLALEPTRTVQPTQAGIAALAKLTNLVSLRVACSGPMEDGVFRGICSLNHLRILRLTAAYPWRSSEYNSITNLQDLAELHVAYCANFTDQQLVLITNLPNLRSIELRADGLSNQATNILAGMGRLTNVVIKPGQH